jgi:ectoine hydroxylase-related dioxygenase (phytanoyl-CoA dioxygenase family)
MGLASLQLSDSRVTAPSAAPETCLEEICARHGLPSPYVNSAQEASEVFAQLGFCVVRNVFSEEDLVKFDEFTMQCVGHVDQQLVGDQSGSQFSRGVGRTSLSGLVDNFFEVEAFQALVQHAVLIDCLDQIYQQFRHDKGWVFAQGTGDIVQPGVNEFQQLHSDASRFRPYRHDSWSQDSHGAPESHPLLVSACPVAGNGFSVENGATVVIPWAELTALGVEADVYDRVCDRDLGWTETPSYWQLCRAVASRGDLFLRDICLPHAGAPNLSALPRTMLAVIAYDQRFMVSNGHMPRHKTLPDDVWNSMEDNVKAKCDWIWSPCASTSRLARFFVQEAARL